MAELRLGVSFDLVYFRQQLQKLSQIAASEFSGKVKLNIDKRAFQRELQALTREIRININDSRVGGASNRIDTLSKKLDELRRQATQKIVIDVEYRQAGTPKRPVAAAAAAAQAATTGGAKRPSFLDSPAYQAELKKIARANAQTLAKAAASLPSGRNRQEVERLLKAFQEQGPQGSSRTAALGAIRELIARGRYQQGLGIEGRLQPLRGQAQTSAARSMPNLNQMLDRIANLTSNPRAAQRMLRMMPESRLTTDLIGAANRQAAFKEQFPQGFRIPGFDAPKAFDPLLKAIAKDFSDYARTINSSDPWVGKVGNGIAQIVAKAAESPQARKLLPSAGGTASPINTLERRLASARGTLGTGGGVAGMLYGGRGPVNPGVSMLSPVGLSGNYRQMAAALANQAANPALAHRQIADIGFGAVPASATGLTGQALNAAINQAFLQRRGFGGPRGQAIPLFSTPGVAVQQGIPGMGYQMGVGGSMGRFPMSGMMGPSTPLTINAQSSMFGAGGAGGGGGRGGRGFGGGFGGFGGGGGPSPSGPSTPFASPLPANYFATGRFAASVRGLGASFSQARLPLAGAIAELGDEFANATKQVLLYGTAYKGLAFFMDLPRQAFDAAKSLQTLNNQLQAVTGSTDNADRAFGFLDDLANRFNVPLASAREGFVKLYASMEPAGFSGNEIEGMFEGISKAAATFGMSADKVDRVNYAFAQMASKGQIMSEELRGQLGDVLPGSLALFARAAQMSIPEFTKAMENGAFQGEAMRQVLRNVATLMNSDFAGAASGAANTLQGALNGMVNAVQRMYEAFEPVVNAIAIQAFPVIEEAINQATQAVKAFSAEVSGNEGPANMLEGNARAIYDAMQQVREIITAVGRVIQGLGPSLALFGRGLLAITDAIAKVINTKIGGFFADFAVKMGIAMIAVQAFARVMGFQLVSSLILAARSATTLRGSIAAMTVALRTSTVAARALRIALSGLVVGAVLVGLEKLVLHIGRVASRLNDARKAALSAASAIKQMSATELVAEKRTRQQNINTLRQVQAAGGKVTQAQARQLEAMGMKVSLKGRLGPGQTGFDRSVDPSLIPSYIMREQQLLTEASFAYQNIDAATAAPQLEAVDLAEKEAKGKKTAGDKLKAYSSDLTRSLQMEMAAKIAAIDADETIFKREKELQAARVRLDYEGRILQEQARLAQQDAMQYTPETRALFLQERKNEFTQEAAKIESDYAKVISGPLAGAVEDYADKLQDEIDALELVTQGVDKLTAVQEAHKTIRRSLLEVTDEDLAKMPQLRDKIEALKESFLALGTEIDNARSKAFTGGLLRELTDVRARLTAPLGQERLIELQQQFRRAGQPESGAAVIFELEQQNERLGRLREGAQALSAEINSGLGNALTSIVTDFQNLQQHGMTFLQTLANGFKQLANTIIQEMTRAMISRAVTSLFGLIGGGTSGSSIVQGVDVPVSQMPTGMAFANGGLVTGPTLGLVGEGRFNEAVVPLPNGKSIPVDLGGAAGNSIATNIVVNINNGQASSSVRGNQGNDLAKNLEGAVKEVIMRETRPGGIIYSSQR